MCRKAVKLMKSTASNSYSREMLKVNDSICGVVKEKGLENIPSRKKLTEGISVGLTAGGERRFLNKTKKLPD